MNVSRIESTLDDGKSPDFDHVLMLIAVQVPERHEPLGYVIERTDSSAWGWAPNVADAGRDDVQVTGESGWQVLTGHSGQQGYTGAVQHPSELWSQCHVDDLVRLADHPGHALLFTCVEVSEPDGGFPDGDPIGWAVAYKLID